MPKPKQSVEEFAVAWWRERHAVGYFPTMDWHWNWRVCDEMDRWFLAAACPTPDDAALEVGCGYGEWMVPLSRLVRSVDGIDLHPTLYDKAWEKFREHGVTNARPAMGDGLSLPYADASFSLVYSIAVFYHVPRAIVHNYLRETARVLRPGGRCVHQFYTAAGDKKPDIRVGETGEWSVGWTAEQALDAAAVAGLAGGRIVDHGDMMLLLAGR
jgi:ubiquinone/menaquinone biosynthesis C-methylase UbiE